MSVFRVSFFGSQDLGLYLRFLGVWGVHRRRLLAAGVRSAGSARQGSDRFPSLGHFQVGSYRYRSNIEGLYTL